MGKRILIMGFTKIKYMPYLNFYLDTIDTTINKVDILYWNRDLQDEELIKFKKCKLFEYRCYQEDDKSKLSKIGSFIKYRQFAKNIFKNNNYDLVIVLHSLTGILVEDILMKYYKQKYIFDYRDSTYEKYSLFKKAISKLVENSIVTFVSSDAFRIFLPKEHEGKTYTSHNILLDSLNHKNDRALYGTFSDRIRIAFWGFIRHEDVNKKIIQQIALDSRFELHYYGREQQVALNLIEFSKMINADNVFFHGEYKPEDRYKFICNTDIIHNIYSDENTMLAMGNKYYDGIIFGIPQLCQKGSFMGKRVESEQIGWQVDIENKEWLDEVFNMYTLQLNKKNNGVYEKVLENLLQEYKLGKRVISDIINM